MICFNNSSSYYGNYRNRKFTDIYPNVATFTADYAIGFPSDQTIKSTSAQMLYYLLYARYGNSTIASSDENQFKAKVRATIMMYGPAWEKKLDIQKKLRALTDAEIFAGSTQIANHAYNPSTEPATDAFTPLAKIDQQNAMKWEKPKLEGYNNLLMLLENDVTSDFLTKFRNLFLKVVEPELPLYYISEDE